MLENLGACYPLLRRNATGGRSVHSSNVIHHSPFTKHIHPSSITSRSLANVRGLRALLALDNFELYRIAFLQALVAFRSDCTVVNENIRPIITPYEAVAFRVVKPLNRTFQTFHLLPLGHVPLHLIRCAEAVPTNWCNCAT